MILIIILGSDIKLSVGRIKNGHTNYSPIDLGKVLLRVMVMWLHL